MAKIYTLATALLTFAFALASFAAIPVRWTTDAYKVKPLVYECYHGETLDMAAALTAYGEPLNFAGKTARLYWQTNGMASAWWSTNAFVRAEAGATNILAAVWSGAYDTGAASVNGFIGVEGENYRAAFQLNFRASPGFSPNQIQMPPKTIDWAKVANANVDAAPFALKGEGGGGMTTNAVKAISANQVTNNVAPWALAGHTEPQGMTGATATNIAQNVIQRNIDTNYLCTVAAAQGMTNGLLNTSHTSPIGFFGEMRFVWGEQGLVLHTKPNGENDRETLRFESISGGVQNRCTEGFSWIQDKNWNSLQSALDAKANANDVYTKNEVYTKTQINGNTVTNGGAVAAAKAYADATTNALSTVAHTGKYDDLSNKPNITNIASVVATNVVRSANGGLWDASLQVWWTPVMSNGKLTYQATTNVNLNACN